MSSGAANGTSRRAFLGRAAGAAAAVAGAGVGAGAFPTSAAAASQRTFTAGRFAFELDGINVGRLAGVDGGDLDGDVVLDVVGSDNIQRKHIAGVKYEDFTLQVGSGMSATFYNWIKDSFDQGVVRKNGAIVSGDYNWNERSRSTIAGAFISSVTIPALDASSKDPAYIAVDLSFDSVVSSPGSGQPVQAAKQKAWLPANFVFQVDGVDTSKVKQTYSFSWSLVSAPSGSRVMNVSDISVTFPHANLASWKEWYDNLIAGADDERDGSLTLVGAQGGDVITVGLYNLGLYRMRPQPGYPGLVQATMYCEKGSWDIKSATKL